jgi:proline dehydrogenase
VNNANDMIKLSDKVVSPAVTDWALKKTFFGHFCGGETGEAIKPTLARLRAAGVRGILDYSTEADLGHAADASSWDAAVKVCRTVSWGGGTVGLVGSSHLVM